MKYMSGPNQLKSLDARSRSHGMLADTANGADSSGPRSPDQPDRMRRFFANRRGSVAVIAAILFPVIVGGLGLGIETGYWYFTQRKLQHAADVSAHAASARNRAGDSITAIRSAALNIATASGFPPSRGVITVNSPPLTGGFAGDKDGVEVVLAETRTRWFTSIFATGQITIRARAVSRLNGGAQACILALSNTAPGAITVSGSTAITLTGCDIASNSVSATSFLMDGTSAALTTGCAYAVGQAQVTSGLTLTTCPAVRVNAPRVRDPYAGVAEPAVIGACQNKNVGNPVNPTTVTPTDSHPLGMKSRHYCNGLDVKGRVTFMPGLYIIEGGTVGFNGGDPNATSAAEFISTGVTFYLRNTSSLQLNGNVKLSMSAPTSGPLSGILFFGARDATSVSHIINGTSDTTLQGAIYAPASLITFKGNSTTTNGCTQIIGNQVIMTGNSSLKSSCDSAGTKTILANEKVAIVE